MNTWSKLVVGAVLTGLVSAQAVRANEPAPAEGDAAAAPAEGKKDGCQGKKTGCKGEKHKGKHHKKGAKPAPGAEAPKAE